MAENSSISWCRHTFNPWMGCTKVSPACDGCYAEALMDKRYHKVTWGPHGERVRTAPANWKRVEKWQREAAAARDNPFVFCASLADVFDNQVPPSWRADLYKLARDCPDLVFLFLTKRPQNIMKLSEAAGGLPGNAALGTTCEDQRRWDFNVPHLIAAKVELRPLFAFVSMEPLLEKVWVRKARIIPELRRFFPAGHEYFDPLHPYQFDGLRLDWIITGGETDQGGHRARPTHPQAFRDVRDECAETGTPYHHKQNGEWVSVSEVAGEGEHYRFADGATVRRVTARKSGRTIDGVVHDAFPKLITRRAA